MKHNAWLIGAAVLFLSGCVTMGDFEKTQRELKANAKKRKVYTSSQAAAKALGEKCLTAKDNKWSFAITDQDAIVKQDDHGTLGYFKTLCFEATGPHKLEVTGVHAGGGFGKAFFLLPKVSLFDASGNSKSIKVSSVKQNAWSGHLEGTIDLGKLAPGKYVLVFEGDNRTGKTGIGTYVQNAYGGGVFISTNIEMYSLPTGKAQVKLQ